MILWKPFTLANQLTKCVKINYYNLGAFKGAAFKQKIEISCNEVEMNSFQKFWIKLICIIFLNFILLTIYPFWISLYSICKWITYSKTTMMNPRNGCWKWKQWVFFFCSFILSNFNMFTKLYATYFKDCIQFNRNIQLHDVILMWKRKWYRTSKTEIRCSAHLPSKMMKGDINGNTNAICWPNSCWLWLWVEWIALTSNASGNTIWIEISVCNVSMLATNSIVQK